MTFMLEFPLQVGQKGIIHQLITHVFDGIVFRDGVVELDSVGVFILVGKKSLEERELLRTGTLQGHEFSANISARHMLIGHRAPPCLLLIFAQKFPLSSLIAPSQLLACEESRMRAYENARMRILIAGEGPFLRG